MDTKLQENPSSQTQGDLLPPVPIPHKKTWIVWVMIAVAAVLALVFWVFLRSNEEATQEFANVLSMKYKKISPVDFSHSNIISIFNPDGELILQEEGANINTQKVADKVNEVVEISSKE